MAGNIHALLEGDRGACGTRNGERTTNPSKVDCENCHAAIRADEAAGVRRSQHAA